MAKVLFVVHRYYPFPGGSEYYVQNMAEEAKKRGHEVWVLTHEFGDNTQEQQFINDIKVTKNYQILGLPKHQTFDLIIVHGGDCVSQNVVHTNALNIAAPVLYLLIKPSDSHICKFGGRHHKYLGYSTNVDLDWIEENGWTDKARRVRHGINWNTTVKPKQVYIDKRVFVSAGGFWPHKRMKELSVVWNELAPPLTELHLYGYGPGEIPPTTDKVKTFYGKSKDEVLQAIANANGYIMNSSEEGFGLVLLEAMTNKTPWYSKFTPGAVDMAQYGNIYIDEENLMMMIRNEASLENQIKAAYEYTFANHTIAQTVNDIEDIIEEDKHRQ